jgi:hypothetical protein
MRCRPASRAPRTTRSHKQSFAASLPVTSSNGVSPVASDAYGPLHSASTRRALPARCRALRGKPLRARHPASRSRRVHRWCASLQVHDAGRELPRACEMPMAPVAAIERGDVLGLVKGAAHKASRTLDEPSARRPRRCRATGEHAPRGAQGEKGAGRAHGPRASRSVHPRRRDRCGRTRDCLMAAAERRAAPRCRAGDVVAAAAWKFGAAKERTARAASGARGAA